MVSKDKPSEEMMNNKMLLAIRVACIGSVACGLWLFVHMDDLHLLSRVLDQTPEEITLRSIAVNLLDHAGTVEVIRGNMPFPTRQPTVDVPSQYVASPLHRPLLTSKAVVWSFNRKSRKSCFGLYPSGADYRKGGVSVSVAFCQVFPDYGWSKDAEVAIFGTEIFGQTYATFHALTQAEIYDMADVADPRLAKMFPRGVDPVDRAKIVNAEIHMAYGAARTTLFIVSFLLLLGAIVVVMDMVRLFKVSKRSLFQTIYGFFSGASVREMRTRCREAEAAKEAADREEATRQRKEAALRARHESGETARTGGRATGGSRDYVRVSDTPTTISRPIVDRAAVTASLRARVERLSAVRRLQVDGLLATLEGARSEREFRLSSYALERKLEEQEALAKSPSEQ